MNQKRRIPIAGSLLFLFACFMTTTFSQDSSLVRVNVLVTETSRDRAVRGLEKENFQIWEDGVAQNIVSMTPGSVDGEYVLAFKSTNTEKDGTWRKLRAKIVSPKGLDEPRVVFSVRFQSGYYAPFPARVRA